MKRPNDNTASSTAESTADVLEASGQPETHVNEIPLSIDFKRVEPQIDLGEVPDVSNESETDHSQTLADSVYPAPEGSAPVSDGQGGTRSKAG